MTIERLRRRLLVVCAAGLVTAMALAACGGDDGDGGGQVSRNAASADAEAFPVTIEHKFGTTEIPEPPERVVTVGYGEDDFALALGVTPVGVRDFIGEYAEPERPWAKEELEAADPEIIGAEQLNFEQVAALQPDLILGVYSLMTERDYETLSKIAPTVAQPDRYVDGGVPWQAETRIDGKALGRSELAERLVAETNAEFEQVRESHPEFEGKTALLAAAAGDVLYGYASEDPRTRFFTDLGFEPVAEIDQLSGGKFYAEFSRERMELFDQDVLILLESETKQEELERDPLFRRLDVAREGRVIFVDADDLFAGALGYSSPLSLPVAIDTMLPKLEAAVDGDPATKVGEVR
jgi:iron complex transport system substrate-binding protein